MINYWVISPFDSVDNDLYQSAWQFCLEQGIISVGHTVPVDLSSVSNEEFYGIIYKYYSKMTPAWQTRKFKMLWQFYNEIKTADLIIVRKGLSVISGVGTVIRTAYFEHGINKSAVGEKNAFHHHLGIAWQKTPRNLHIKSSGFARGAFLQKIPKSKYLSLFDSK